MNPCLLSAIAEKLNNDGLNYSVFLQSYAIPITDHYDANAYIRDVLGNDAVAEVIKDIAGRCLSS